MSKHKTYKQTLIYRVRTDSFKMYVENVRQSSQLRLLNLITTIAPNNVQKDLVIHEDLMKPVDQVAGARLLRYLQVL